jgi:hypothetical protein
VGRIETGRDVVERELALRRRRIECARLAFHRAFAILDGQIDDRPDTGRHEFRQLRLERRPQARECFQNLGVVGIAGGRGATKPSYAARKQCRFADAQCGCELENPLLQMLLPCDRVALAPGWTTTLQHRIGGRCESRRARLEYLRGHWRRRIHRSNLSSVGCP